MKGGVVTKLRLIVFLPSILVLWDDKGTLAGSVPQRHDYSCKLFIILTLHSLAFVNFKVGSTGYRGHFGTFILDMYFKGQL